MIRLGFVGFGRMGLTHYAILRPHPEVEVVGVADPSRPMRRLLSRNLDLRLFSTHEELFEQARPDAVIVAPPTRYHAPVVRQALEAGIHVFVEKPLSLDPDQSRDLAALARDRGVVGQVGYVHRSNPVFREARRLLRAGAVGTVCSFGSQMFGATLSKAPSGWRGRSAEGGGCLYEFAAHAIDLVVFLLGPPEAVGGTALDRVFSPDTEDLVNATLFLADGTSGLLQVNWADGSFRKPTNRITVYGTEGHLEVDPYGLALWVRTDRPELDLRAGWNRRYITDLARPVRFYVRGNAFTRQLDAFVEAVRDGRPEAVPCTLDEAAQTDRVIALLRQDAQGASPGANRAAPRRRRRDRLAAWLRRIVEVFR